MQIEPSHHGIRAHAGKFRHFPANPGALGQQEFRHVGKALVGRDAVFRREGVIEVHILKTGKLERVAAVPDPDFMRMLKRELTAVRRLLNGG